MNVISVVNQKGGCGKTVTAVNLAASLSKKGYRVLLLDLDPQAHATYALGQKGGFTISEILERITENSSLPAEGIYHQISDSLFFIPSRMGLASLEQSLASHENKLQILKAFINQIAIPVDYCIIDCPPNLGLLTLNALVASTYCLIPLMLCDFSLRGVEMLKNILVMLKEYNGASPAPFYVLTQVDTRSCFARDFLAKVRNQLGNLLLATSIKSNIYLREAAAAGKHIFDYKPESRGAEDFWRLAEEIAMLTIRQKWTPLFFKGDKFNKVYIAGDFNNWQKEETYRLKKIGEDIWAINLPLEKGTYRYKFVADENWVADPQNDLAEDDSFGGKHSLLFID